VRRKGKMMRRLFAVAACLVVMLLAGVASSHAQLVLNEILAAPASDWDGSGAYSSRDDEWVEVYNAGAESVSLDSLLLRDGTHLVRYRFSGSLASHAVVLVFGSQAYAWEKANGQAADGLSLNNTGDTVDLLKIVGPDTLLCDSRVYGKNEGGSERSVGRLPDGSAAWVLFDALNLYTGTGDPPSTGCSPTPGSLNAVCSTNPVEPATWGRIKSLYGESGSRGENRTP
jgi:hypothetical protein